MSAVQYSPRMPTPVRRHRYVPRGTQAEAIRAGDSEVLLSGPAGTGKSRACLEKVHWMCLMYPGMRALMVRKTQVSLVESGLVTFKRDVVRDMLDREVRWYGGSGSEPAAFRYSNGSVVIIGGMDKASKVLSTEYDVIYVQEATELEEDDWETLTTRLRNGVAPIQQIIADCNPQEPTHWLKQRCDAGKTRMLNSHHTENPLLYGDDGRVTERGHRYMSKLEALSGVRKLRLFNGLWAAAEGVIYEEWNPAIHLIDPFVVPDSWARYWSVDFGFTNPFVWQNWAINPDGVMFLSQEIYRTQTIIEDHAKEIAWLTQGQRAPQVVVTDHDPDGQQTLSRHLGQVTRGVFGSRAPVSAYKKVKEGIEAVKVRLRSERLFVFQGAVSRRDQELVDQHKPTCTADELPGYVWAEQKTPGVPKDEPLKENDHGCLVAGTLITAKYLLVPIEKIVPGRDEVWTRGGWRRVLDVALTDSQALVYRAVMSNGEALTGTGDHPIWVQGKGYTRLDSLRYGDKLEPCPKWSEFGLVRSGFGAIQSRSSGPSAATSRPALRIDSEESVTSIKKSGKTPGVRYLTAARSIIATSIRSITSWATSSASPLRNTKKRTASEAGSVANQRSHWLTSRLFDRSRKPGINRQKALNGIERMPSDHGNLESRLLAFASSVGADTSALNRDDSAPTGAKPRGGMPAEWTMSGGPVSTAVTSSPLTGTARSDAVDVYVLHVTELEERQAVYNLTVADQHEYFANGVLTHNCDALRYMVAHLDLVGRPALRFVS